MTFAPLVRPPQSAAHSRSAHARTDYHYSQLTAPLLPLAIDTYR